MSISMNNWILPEELRIPDFIICGAMKSGTSTLHYILNQHPHIYIPDNEIFFFNIDDLFQHSDFNYFDGGNWHTQELDDDPVKFWKWYSSHFDSADANQTIGEDSTTYIASEIAAKRIRVQNKLIKLIIILRHPTVRAYSEYLHMVRTGRAIYNFENTIRYTPYSILYRSLYFDQLKRFFKHVSKKQVKVVIFEQFLVKKYDLLREICVHIGVDYDLFPKDSMDAHKNKALIPKYPGIQILKNRYFREVGNLHYYSNLPVKPTSSNKRKAIILRLINKAHSILNPLTDVKPPKMKDSTKQFIDDFFKRELTGINELLGKDVLSIWFD